MQKEHQRTRAIHDTVESDAIRGDAHMLAQLVGGVDGGLYEGKKNRSRLGHKPEHQTWALLDTQVLAAGLDEVEGEREHHRHSPEDADRHEHEANNEFFDHVLERH